MARRIAVLGVVLVALGAATLGGWAWWTAPPADDAASLAAAARSVPADADGLVVLARPTRAARWLARHPQSLALLLAAAPDARAALPRVQGWIAALTTKAKGPVTVWWRGRGAAATASVSEPAAEALARLAALEGLPFRAGSGGAVSAASDASLLEIGSALATAPPERGPLAGLARARGTWWSIRAGRSRLDLTSGTPPALPGARPEDMISTNDLASLVAPTAAPDWLPHAPAILLAGGGGWALALPQAEISEELRRLLSLSGDAPVETQSGARHWRGPLGDLWVVPGRGFAVASSAELLASLPRDVPVGDSGFVHGAELAQACARLAEAADAVPGGAPLARSLSRVATAFGALRSARWCLRPEGARIVLEW